MSNIPIAIDDSLVRITDILATEEVGPDDVILIVQNKKERKIKFARIKNWIESELIQGLDTKESCKAATTENITLSGTQTIDGVEVAKDDRVLVKNQTTKANNGIYIVATGAWTRAEDFSDGKVTTGAFTFVEEGTVNADTGWVLSTKGEITIGTTELTFTQFSAAGVISVSADDPLSVTKTGTNYKVTFKDITLNTPTSDSTAPAAVTTATAITSLLQTIWNKLKYLFDNKPAYTYCIDSDAKLADWANNTNPYNATTNPSGNDYSRILIKENKSDKNRGWVLNSTLSGGTSSSPRIVIDISDGRTQSVVGESGSKIVINNSQSSTYLIGIKGNVTGTYPNFTNPDKKYFF